MDGVFIFIMGDDDRLKKTVKIILRKEGYIVFSIKDVSEMMNLIQSGKADKEHFFIIIYISPLNDQGSIEIFSGLQKDMKNLAFIIIYEYLNPITIRKMKQTMRCTFLEKSFDAGVLNNTIASILKDNRGDKG